MPNIPTYEATKSVHEIIECAAAFREWLAGKSTPQSPPAVALELGVPRKKQSRWISHNELESKKGIRCSRPTLKRWEGKGKFPRRFYPGPAKARYFYWEHEIDEWNAEQGDARGNRGLK